MMSARVSRIRRLRRKRRPRPAQLPLKDRILTPEEWIAKINKRSEEQKAQEPKQAEEARK
jgi:hypothetical protein